MSRVQFRPRPDHEGMEFIEHRIDGQVLSLDIEERKAFFLLRCTYQRDDRYGSEIFCLNKMEAMLLARRLEKWAVAVELRDTTDGGAAA